MALIGGIFTSTLDAQGNPDRTVDEEYWDEYHKSFLTNGIYPSPADSFLVRAKSAMTLIIRPGACFIAGKYAYDKSEAELTVPAAGASIRRDRVVLRMDLTQRRFELALKQGTSATAPALTRNSNTWELGLAIVSVAPGVTAITQSEITDTRPDVDSCGWVTAPLHEVNFVGLEAQCRDSFDAFMALIAGKLGDDPATSLQSQINQRANQNLLINGDFRVHQRGSSFAGLYNNAKGLYTADRWMVYCTSTYNSYLTVTCADTGGLQITNSRATSCDCTLRYYTEDMDLYALRGRKLAITYSIGGVKSYEIKTIPASQASRLLISKSLSVPASSTLTVDYVKAEIVDNSVTTAEQAATPYVPRPYARELDACRRYYQTLPEIHIPQAYFDLVRPNFEYYFPTPMRIAPTESHGGIAAHKQSDSTLIQGGSASISKTETHRAIWWGSGFKADGMIKLSNLKFDAEIYS